MTGSQKAEAAKRPRGRPRAATEDAALAAAMEVFWRRGFAEASLDEIVVASGVARATLYKSFGDKRALLARALDLYAGRFEARVDAALATQPTARAALGVLLAASAERLADPAAPPGCLRCNSTLELAGRDAALDEALADANARFLAQMERIVARGVAAGELAPERAASLPRTLTALVNGLVTLARGGADRAALDGVAAKALDLWPPR